MGKHTGFVSSWYGFKSRLLLQMQMWCSRSASGFGMSWTRVPLRGSKLQASPSACAGVAQSAEQSPCKRKVAGSNPVASPIFNSSLRSWCNGQARGASNSLVRVQISSVAPMRMWCKGKHRSTPSFRCEFESRRSLS